MKLISREQLIVAVPVALVAATAGFLVGRYLGGHSVHDKSQQRVNTCISKDSPKVVHSFDMEDIAGTQAVFCRCWKSKTFPYCDGSHNKHNEETGDNVGPLIIKRRTPSAANMSYA